MEFFWSICYPCRRSWRHRPIEWPDVISCTKCGNEMVGFVGTEDDVQKTMLSRCDTVLTIALAGIESQRRYLEERLWQENLIRQQKAAQVCPLQRRP